MVEVVSARTYTKPTKTSLERPFHRHRMQEKNKHCIRVYTERNYQSSPCGRLETWLESDTTIAGASHIDFALGSGIIS